MIRWVFLAVLLLLWCEAGGSLTACRISDRQCLEIDATSLRGARGEQEWTRLVANSAGMISASLLDSDGASVFFRNQSSLLPISIITR